LPLQRVVANLTPGPSPPSGEGSSIRNEVISDGGMVWEIATLAGTRVNPTPGLSPQAETPIPGFGEFHKELFQGKAYF